MLDTAALERQKVPSGAAVAAAWSDDDATPAAKRLRQGHDPYLAPGVESEVASSLGRWSGRKLRRHADTVSDRLSAHGDPVDQ